MPKSFRTLRAPAMLIALLCAFSVEAQPYTTGNVVPMPAATPASGTGGLSSVSVGTASTVVSAAATRTARLSVSVLHASAKVYCTLGATAVAGTGYLVGNMPGVFNFANDAYVPADALNCISDTASTPVTVWSK